MCTLNKLHFHVPQKATCDFERKTLNFVLNPEFENQSIQGVADKKVKPKFKNK